jgi:5-bromo-4-chloroindolyl phosphate hydrolysis protein
MSFTTGGLFQRESVGMAEQYLKLRNWNKVRDEVMAENLLQTRTINTAKRVCSEIISRLKMLDENELDYLITASHRKKGCLLWLTALMR